MRLLLNIALSLLLALQGFVAPVHACGAGAAATGPAAIESGEATADAGEPDCHGHGPAHVAPASSTLAVVPEADTAGSTGVGDCCGSGNCGCPCATLKALPPTLLVQHPQPGPGGAPVAALDGVRPQVAAPPLRPPIS